jgi:DNA-binding transcriptional LysR family regulator
VSLLEAEMNAQFESIRKHEADLGIMYSFDTPSGFISTIIAHERVMAVVPENHPLTNYPGVNLMQLAREPLVMFARQKNPRLYDGVLELMRLTGTEPFVVQQIESTAAKLAAVASGIGITFLPESAREFELRGVQFLEITDLPIELPVAMIRREHDASPWLNGFIEASRTVTNNSIARH